MSVVPLSLSLPHKGGGNRGARTFATQTTCLQIGRENTKPDLLHTRAFLSRTILATSLAVFAAGCSSIERLKSIGEQPTLSQISNPTTQAGYKPVQMPMPAPQPASYNPNSLWRNGSRAFFKDQRAHQVGDILTVTVNITDKAAIDNETSRSRSNKEDSGVTDFIGSKTIKTPATAILPGRILHHLAGLIARHKKCRAHQHEEHEHAEHDEQEHTTARGRAGAAGRFSSPGTLCLLSIGSSAYHRASPASPSP